MDDTLKFKEGLAAVISAAKLSDNHMTKAQVESCFKGISLNEEQWELVYSYLELAKITVDDYETDGRYSELFADLVKEEERSLSEEDEKLYNMYLEDLKAIEALAPAEEAVLVEKMLAGDGSVRNRLIEGRLMKVVDMSKRYCGKGVLMSDLVQEGNIALMMAVSTFSGGDYDAWINSEVEEAFKAVVMEQDGYQSAGNYLAAEANALMETTAQIAEELGREATLEELSSKMNLSEEAVRDIMKISMDAMDFAEATGNGEQYGKTDTISEEDKAYFEAAYEDGGVSGDGWTSVSADAYYNGHVDDEADASDFLNWLSEDDEEDAADSDDYYGDDSEDGGILEFGWNI